ncbi:5911_t:CDS:2, partial [Paraglomus occultum]
MVGRWMKQTWTSGINKHKKTGSGRTAFYPEAEQKLYDWIIAQRKQGIAVNYVDMRAKMLEILRKPDIIFLYGDSAECCRVSSRWISAFMKRYKLSLRRSTKISQKLPAHTHALLQNFNQFVNNLRATKSFELHNIFNMDETPVWFDMAGNFTVNPKGEKTVHIRGTGNEKSRFTVVLTCAAAGLTSICQPLDVAINKPFKDNLRKEWHLWMASGGAGETAAGNLRRARISDVCGWVK